VFEWVVMAEGDQSGTLGRILSWIGYLWALFAILWGVGVIEALGLSGSIASSIGSTIFPAIILIGIGRFLKKRAEVDDGALRPDVSPQTPPTPPILTQPTSRVDFPAPVTPPKAPPPPPRMPKKDVIPPDEAATRAEPIYETSTTGDLGSTPGRHKTSQELIDEARQRWGTKP
jgi:hypothetical protein